MPKERQTCTECSMRRQKCDRKLPCSRCVKRGEADKCTREWPKEGYDPKVHRTYPRSGKPETNLATQDEIENTQTDSVIEAPTGSSLHPSLLGISLATYGAPDTRSSTRLQTVHASPEVETSINNDESTVGGEKWGAQSLSDYQIQSLNPSGGLKIDGLARDIPTGEWEYSNGFGNSNSAQVSFLQLLFPNRAQLSQLVEYHIQNLLWQHCSFHGPTFSKELKELSSGPMRLQIRDMDLRWAALLFAIMAGSMACVPDSISAQWGFQKSEKAKLTRQWFKAALSCLNMADYMWRHHLNSVQTICTLIVSAHVLGFSNTQSTLLGAGLKIAQGLGLQRLSAESEDSPDKGITALSSEQRERTIKREIGRRVWAQLCNQDWFSIPFSDMYSVQRHHFTSIAPRNVDEETMLPVPNHLPTQISFESAIHKLAAVMPQVHDAILSSNTLYTKYEQVLHFDSKIKALANEGLPSYFSSKEPISPEWPPFISWARRTLKVSFAHKIIMIHRNFLGRSFSDSTFEYTRQSSIEAAKTILDETKQAYEDQGPNLWIDQAFMVAAGITLSLDIFHRKSTDPEHNEHRVLVERAITQLEKFEHSMIAQRGVRLLSSLLTEQARLMATKSIDSYRKRTREGSSDLNSTPKEFTTAPQFTHVGNGARAKRQKFDVPKFVENFVGQDDSFTATMKSGFLGRESNNVTVNMDNSDTVGLAGLSSGYGQGKLGNALLQTENLRNQTANSVNDTATEQFQYPHTDLGFDTFEQIFPPHMGMNNSFLFEDLLNFEL